MTSKTRNIIIITSAVLIIGAGVYLFMKNKSRNRLSKKQEAEEGKEVKEWKSLIKNFGQYIPDGGFNSSDARTSKEGDKLTKKIFPYQYFATTDAEGKAKWKISAYYYADGDFRIYVKPNVKGGESVWFASGKWIGDTPTKVFIQPKVDNINKIGKWQDKVAVGKITPVKKGTYSGINIKDMLSKIFKTPIGYYDNELKAYVV